MALLGGSAIALASVVVSVVAWWLSMPVKLSSPNGCVSPILLTLAVIMVNLGAAALWFRTDWTVGGPRRDASAWVLFSLLVLPGAIGAGIYATLRRLRISKLNAGSR
jgi:hypothetical protein